MDRPTLPVDPLLLERLSDPGDPALRVRVLKDLLGRPDDDPELVEARTRIPEQAWISSTLQAQKKDGSWGPSLTKGYTGTIWVLYHLSEVGAPVSLHAIRNGVALLQGEGKPVPGLRGRRAEMFGGETVGRYWEFPTACFTARVATTLIRYGPISHSSTEGALRACEALFEPEEGFNCFVMDDSLLPACFMAVPSVLKAFLAVPSDIRSIRQQGLIEDMVALLKRRHLFRYVARDRRAWQEWGSAATAAERREESPRWLAAGRADPREEKAGWLRFSFPHGYNSDLLEVLLLLGEVGAELDDVVEEGLRLLLSKREDNGMWRMVGGLNGKMHANLDEKSLPSPWLTYRALLAFKRFGLLRV